MGGPTRTGPGGMILSLADSKTPPAISARDYLRCLVSPESYTARVPSPLPIETSVSQTKATVTITADGLGNLVGCLSPLADSNVLTWTTTGPSTDAMTWNNASVVFTSNYPSSILTSARLRRVVAACVNLEVMTPVISRQGILSACFLPYTGSTAPISNDTLRDQPGCATVNVAQNPHARCVWHPYDPQYNELWAPGTSISGGTFPTLAFCLSGAVANAQVMVSFRIVHEFVPQPAVTDLLMPTPAPVGSQSETLSAFRDIASTGILQSKGKSGDFAQTIGVRPGKGTWTNDILAMFRGAAASVGSSIAMSTIANLAKLAS